MRKFVLRIILPALIGTYFSTATAQVDKDVLNWYNSDKTGMSTDKAHKYLKKRTPETVVVAVIDSGIDIEHEDLQGRIWTNTKEIPGNGIDDDGNGYIDDVHGWNFLGNSDGTNLGPARLEATRIYGKLKPRFDDVENPEDVSADDRKDYELYLELKEEVEGNLEQYKGILAQVGQMASMEPMLKGMVASMLEKEDFTEKDLKKFKPKDAQQKQYVDLGYMILSGEFVPMMEEQAKAIQSMVDHHHNVDFNERAIIGDDYMDMSDLAYGNGNVTGPIGDALHGTHVGGIIGAVRGNKIGGDGVADNVLLMSLRAVPDGDEFDKDIALAIRYAVDNGAKVINASFGKAYAQLAEEVYAALRYAEENDVLFVHAAGNSGQNLDEYPNYPANMFPFQNEPFTNYLSIGASTRNHDGNLAASFSNYSTTRVDVFAPGAEIYNTVPENKYQELQGTSMAAPMVSGVAALLKGYFPKFTMTEIRQIILDSADNFADSDQAKPGTGETVKFKTLSSTGGVVNVLAAVKLAEERYAGK
jgi:subtilisin family serine protease